MVALRNMVLNTLQNKGASLSTGGRVKLGIMRIQPPYIQAKDHALARFKW